MMIIVESSIWSLDTEYAVTYPADEKPGVEMLAMADDVFGDFFREICKVVQKS